MRAVSAFLVVLTCALGTASYAHAQTTTTTHSPSRSTVASTAPTVEEHTMFAYGFQGMLAGGLVGLGSGYLRERDGGEKLDTPKWQRVGLWSGGGAAAGLLLGLAFGAADRSDEARRGTGGYLIVSDVLGGTLAGGAIGGTVGAFIANTKDDPERAAYSAAFGGLVGAGLGLLIGIAEAPGSRERKPAYTRRRIEPLVANTRDARNRPMWMLGASGRF